MRTKYILLIPELFSSDNKCDQSLLEVCLEEVLNEMILPNLIWKAGRAASAVRMSATASLVLIMQSEVVKTVVLKENTLDSFTKQILACLDDDNKTTRLYACKIFVIALTYFGQLLSIDQLHKFYLEFIKRLDDQNDDIRFEILRVFQVYFSCLNRSGYDKVLYKAHVQNIYENLLLYLDDNNKDFQLKILSMPLFFICSILLFSDPLGQTEFDLWKTPLF